ncbi:hypothetical protein N657DRAFT_104810 [Parathielavia appendiculata]|uniref:Uncharacterized protein n=1 Tax=Parathielavia appendiculata TaxID=2587402 RepID=A0AAN6TWH0_9PEZI|nr:hypothetical protein N657DRAFT_104810 [Parathielavia appendiculata]
MDPGLTPNPVILRYKNKLAASRPLLLRGPRSPRATISVLTDNSSIASTRAGFTMVSEVGLSSGVYSMMNGNDRGYRGKYGGLGAQDVLEVLLWQRRWPDRVWAPGIIQELYGEYKDLQARGNQSGSKYLEQIAVQCISSSAMGSATPDGITDTYWDFRQEDDAAFDKTSMMPDTWNVPRLSMAVPAMFIPGIRGSGFYDLPDWSHDASPQFAP